MIFSFSVSHSLYCNPFYFLAVRKRHDYYTVKEVEESFGVWQNCSFEVSGSGVARNGIWVNIANAISIGQGKLVTANTQLLSANTLVESLHEVLKVGEEMRVRQMLMGGNQLAIYPHVELAVNARNECEGRNVLAYPRQRVVRHPGGSERVSSILAVFYLYTQFVICHETAS